MRADSFLEAGGGDGSAAWKRVLRAISARAGTVRDTLGQEGP